MKWEIGNTFRIMDKNFGSPESKFLSIIGSGFISLINHKG